MEKYFAEVKSIYGVVRIRNGLAVGLDSEMITFIRIAEGPSIERGARLCLNEPG